MFNHKLQIERGETGHEIVIYFKTTLDRTQYQTEKDEKKNVQVFLQ